MPTPEEIAARLKRRNEAAARGMGTGITGNPGRPPVPRGGQYPSPRPAPRPAPKPAPQPIIPWDLVGAGLDAVGGMLRRQRPKKRPLRRAPIQPRDVLPQPRSTSTFFPRFNVNPRMFGAQPMPSRSGMQSSRSLFSRSERAILPQRAVPGGTLLNPVQRPVPQQPQSVTLVVSGGAPLSQIPMADVHRWSANSNRGTGPMGMTVPRELAQGAVAPRAGATSLVNRGRAIDSIDRTNPAYAAPVQPSMPVGATRYF